MDKNYPEREIKLSQPEILALKKMILYIKFSCREEESIIFSGSYSINSVLKKIINADDFSFWSKNIYCQVDEEKDVFIKDKISKYMDDHRISNEEKQELYEQCLYPYKIDLGEEGDK